MALASNPRRFKLKQEASAGPSLAAVMAPAPRRKPPVAAAPARKPLPHPATVAAAARPTIEQQASALARSLLQPTLDQFTQAANARADAGTQAIKGYSTSLANAFAGHDYTAPYAQGISDQAGVDAALHAALTGAGSDAADALKSRLAAGGVDPAAVDAAVGTVSQNATGSANTALGLGSAELGRLVAGRTAAADFGQKLPGIAGLAGLQDVSGFQNSVTADLNDKLGQLVASEPQLRYGILQDLQKRQDDQAAAAAAAKAAGRKVNETLSAAAGHLVNDMGETIPGPGGKPVPYTPYEKPSTSFQIVKGADGYYRVGQDGSVTPLGVTPPASGSDGSGATHMQSKTVNGHVFNYDPTTGVYTIPGDVQPVNPNSFRKPVKASTTALKNGRQFLQQTAKGFYASQVDPTKPITAAAIRTAATDAGMSVGDFLSDTDQAAQARANAGIGFNQVAPGDDNEIQQLYLTLVKQYGIPARQAFSMVAGTYKQWGKRHADYFPKASAAQDAASPTGYRGGRLDPAQQTDLARRALQMVAPNLATPGNVQALVGRINQESGGNPVAINLWDSNAKAGHPSKGILQTIDSTFANYAVPGHGDIYNPLDNALAAIRYMLARYGRIVGPSNSGY